jgi:hypothetical protein
MTELDGEPVGIGALVLASSELKLRNVPVVSARAITTSARTALLRTCSEGSLIARRNVYVFFTTTHGLNAVQLCDATVCGPFVPSGWKYARDHCMLTRSE